MYNKSGTKWQKRFTKMHNIRLPLFITIIALIFVILVLGIDKKKPNSPLKLGLANKKDTSLDPTVKILNGTEVIWQIPDSPRSILFIAHGCNGRAANFWDKSPNCDHCVGLPEERAIVIEALARKFAVVAVSSRGKCWSLMKETLVVERVIKWWVKKQNLESLPLVALGASSGGYFVSMLASKMRFSSIVVMIAEGVFEDIDVTKAYPPTLFVHMPKDKRRKKLIDVNLEVLRREGVDVAEVKCLELPLSPTFLADRVPGLDRRISEELFDMFKEKGFVDEKGYLGNDGRVIPWKEAMSERKLRLPNKVLVNYIQEELNLAFAYHEMTSLQSEQIFNWFESHLR
ncbi:putative alpha/Beta hydrolase [Helianthus annuus]|nr:putative alpha/Beta hydrolase [Helianthus annuus]KAJ0866154.1 putative alpha/Beta hydrolase [Helianthus annuus]